MFLDTITLLILAAYLYVLFTMIGKEDYSSMLILTLVVCIVLNRTQPQWLLSCVLAPDGKLVRSPPRPRRPGSSVAAAVVLPCVPRLGIA